MDIPASSAAARAHIQQIRRSKGLDGVFVDTSDLESALSILSEQLYQKSTHFLLELIQNADDNRYLNHRPSLTVTYKDRTLRIDSNEIGFSKANVEAICKIGRSTKIGANDFSCIGEKGIGFNVLGMIAPIWAEFPAAKLKDQTSILLHLDRHYDPEELITEIKHLDPRLLTFLRQLKAINLVVHEGNRDPWTRSIEKNEVIDPKSEVDLIELRDNSWSRLYRIIRYSIDKIPPNSRRRGHESSNITLAFPLETLDKPWIEAQDVYAYLPIRDYGFKFLIHADFLLVASREDIDASAIWNDMILKHLPFAFLKAAKMLNVGPLCYTWIRYFPHRPPINDMFRTFEIDLALIVSNSPVLESLSGELTKPTQLNFVTQQFVDNQGLPLIMSDRMKSTYISNKYFFRDRTLLARVGVQMLTAKDFLNDLRNAITVDPAKNFQNKSSLWQSSLFNVLIQLSHERAEFKSFVSELNIVRLRNDRWVSAKHGHLHIPLDFGAVEVPNGIGIYEVHWQALRDDNMKNLLLMLGAQQYRPDQICDLISQAHHALNNEPNIVCGDVTIAEMTSHVEFLFEANWRNNNRQDIWLVSESGILLPSSRIYLDSEPTYSATKMLVDRERFAFIHPFYRNRHDKFRLRRDDWKKWMLDTLLVEQYPRLVYPVIGSNFNMSPDFRYLLNNLASDQILLLLKDRWKNYARHIMPDSTQVDLDGTGVNLEASKARVRQILSEMKVRCRGEHFCSLHETVLPLYFMDLEDFSSLTILDLPNPEDHGWKFLQHFGVVVDSGAPAMLQCLRRLKSKGTNAEQIFDIYKRLDALATLEGGDIRKAFEEEELLFIPVGLSGEQAQWAKLESCVWDGPKALRTTPCIKEYYLDLQHFFCTVLGLGQADLNTFIQEAGKFVASDSLEYISDIFRSISSYVEGLRSTKTSEDIENSLERLLRLQAFPVMALGDSAYDRLMCCTEDDVWMIADRWHLRKSFEGRIPLLALSVETIEDMGELISITRLRDRLLSRRALGTPVAKGKSAIHEAMTEQFNRKARFMARLVPKAAKDRPLIFEQLRDIQVLSSKAVVVEWMIKDPAGKPWEVEQIAGRAQSGRVSIVPASHCVQIFLQESDITAVCPPIELQEAMAEYLRISISSHLIILHWILTERNISAIEEGMKRHGISKDAHDFGNPTSATYNVSHDQNDERHFYGVRKHERPAPEDKDETSLALAAFAKRFDSAQSIQNLISQPWNKSNIENMLSYVCELDHQSAQLLLPQGDDSLGRAIMDAGGTINDFVGVFFQDKVWHSKRALASERTFPAIVKATGKRMFEVLVSKQVTTMVDEEANLAAELQVSKLLEETMGGAYNPAIHWTSPLRVKAGLRPVEDVSDEAISTFAINDKSGMFTRYLVHNGFKQAASWRRYPFYHLEVVPSEGDLYSVFSMDPRQIAKARDCQLPKASAFSRQSPNQVFVLVRVLNIRTKPEAILLVDPWQMHVDGALSLTSESFYSVSIQDSASIIQLQESSKASPTNLNTPTSFKRLSKNLLGPGQKSMEQYGHDSSFTYRRLSAYREIRLLELSPGHQSMPLHGVIHHKVLDAAGPFFALSYVWSSGIKTSSVQTSEGDMKITASLESALRRLRRTDAAIILWIDAICIDQSNHTEKTTQIRLMKSIFESAEQVIAWIGDEKENSLQAIEALLRIRTFALQPDQWPVELSSIPKSWETGLPPANDKIWEEIGNLLTRKWFKRAWIVQEVVVASEIQLICGSWELKWDDFFLAVERCLQWAGSIQGVTAQLRYFTFQAKPFYSLGVARRQRHGPELQRSISLLSLLDTFAHTEATIDRDKLFALIGVASDTSDAVFDPDYHSSKITVLRRYANEFIRRGLVLSLLYSAGVAKGSTGCSWIPDWTGSKQRPTISSWRGAEGVFCAGGTQPTWANTISNESNKLQLAGTIIDRIKFVSNTSTDESDIISVINNVRSHIDSIASYPTHEDRKELKLKLPTGNAATPFQNDMAGLEKSFDDHQEIKKTLDYQEGYDDISSIKDMTDFLKKPRNARERTWSYWSTAAEFMRRLCKAKYCSTVNGHVGLVPHEARVGDEICIVRGGTVPFLLRKAPDDRTSLGLLRTLIGECYIHGIMYGEALSMQKSSVECILLV